MMKMLVTLIKKENKKQASLPALVAGKVIKTKWYRT